VNEIPDDGMRFTPALFEFRQSGGETVPCDCCGFPAPVAEFNNSPPTPRLLCEFCANSMAGAHTRDTYRRIDDTTRLTIEIWKAAGAVANYLKFGVPKE
jgi:hypothetical protein